MKKATKCRSEKKKKQNQYTKATQKKLRSNNKNK